MAERKYEKYVFTGFDEVEKKMGYNFPGFEGKVQTYVFDKYWHKSDEIKVWAEMDLHYNVGAHHGLGIVGYANEDGPNAVCENSKKGDPVLKLGVHRHNAPELFMMFGTDPKNPGKLGGEYEFYIGLGEEAERYVFDTNTIIYVPAGVYHNPNGATRIDDPEHPIGQIMLLLTEGHFSDDESGYAMDDDGNPIYPPGLVPEE